jgi:hypothetical protein
MSMEIYFLEIFYKIKEAKHWHKLTGNPYSFDINEYLKYKSVVHFSNYKHYKYVVLLEWYIGLDGQCM